MVVSANLNHDPWAREARAHWQKYRPKMFKQMQDDGSLEHHLRNAVQRAQDQYAVYVESGITRSKPKARQREITCSCRTRTTCPCWARIPTHYQILPT